MILILAGLEAVTVVHHHPDNEYVLEHEVTYEAAIAEARKLQLYHGEIIYYFFFFLRKIYNVKCYRRLLLFINSSQGDDSLYHSYVAEIYVISQVCFFDLSLCIE